MQNDKLYDINACLKDIEQSIIEINEFLPAERNFFEFQKDLKTRKAVERNIEIIGEAMDRILKTNPDFQISDSRKIVDTRNRIIHGYDSVSDDVIWLIDCESIFTDFRTGSKRTIKRFTLGFQMKIQPKSIKAQIETPNQLRK